MDTNRLKSFAQRTRVELMGQVARRLEAALAEDSAERREAPAAMKALEDRIAREGERQVIEQVAYTWFNRFTALRYMDANGYLTPMVVTPAPDRTRPELLDQAAAGALPDHLRAPVADRVRDLLEGRAPAREPQVEAYRLLVVATCNHLGGVMPFLFEQIADYTELLMPNELLAADGWVAEMRGVMTEEACQDVEIIGWLYQFYISEKKDQVFAGLKKNQKITAENIPAATQLFTPHWIVRYLVENSLGRLWLLNRPGSRLAERMEYYIAPEEPETDFLRVTSPEEIRVCDPACGSGHMLTYAFDLLYAIYEEEGYDPVQIPELILRNNLTGIEIDDRAGALAAFALAMKAAAKIGRRRFLRMEVKPDVVVLENVEFTGQDRVGEFLRMIGEGANHELAQTLDQFAQAKNFGSLIVPKLKNPGEVLEKVRAKDFEGDIIWEGVRDRVVAVLRMAEALAPRYHVVVANPPYMGTGAMNGALKTHVGSHFARSKADLGAVFIERCKILCKEHAYTAMITMQGWMFLSRYEGLRQEIIKNSTIVSLAHLGERAFDSIGGAVVSTAAYILQNTQQGDVSASFVRLTDGRNEAEKEFQLKRAAGGSPDFLYHHRTTEFSAIPGCPICYWLPSKTVESFKDNPLFGDRVEPRKGMVTADNEQYIRFHWEVSSGRIGRDCSDRNSAKASGCKWFPYNKGGERRKWYGNDYHVVNWENDGQELQNRRHPVEDRIWATNFNLDYIFRPSLSWTDITTDGLAARLVPQGFLFDSTAWSAFESAAKTSLEYVAAICNTKVGQYISLVLNPTLHFTSGDFARFPLIELSVSACEERTAQAVDTARKDWDWSEFSATFTTFPLLCPDLRSGTLEAAYARLRAHWAGMTAEMQRLEEENNRIFIDAYGLQDELTPEVPIEEITLTCNPAYSFKSEKTDEAREKRLLEQTMKEFISYAIGCMFGRYSLDAPGLILANQGDTIQTYLDRIPEPSFMPDRDNVIPLFEEDWFEDDAYQRFREFLSLTFGEDRLVENLEFMRQALGKEVRAYLAKDFYADHVQRYKKRPIYWLVSSPKGAFQALIYMHRYTPDTLNITLNDYVRALRDKLEAGMRAAKALEINPDASAAEKNRSKRDIDRFTKQIAEVTEWERDLLYPLAVERIRIDLDDGVKANYPKFPGVLKPIKGLEAKDA